MQLLRTPPPPERQKFSGGWGGGKRPQNLSLPMQLPLIRHAVSPHQLGPRYEGQLMSDGGA